MQDAFGTILAPGDTVVYIRSRVTGCTLAKAEVLEETKLGNVKVKTDSDWKDHNVEIFKPEKVFKV